jgi:peroxiredoxin
MPMSAALLVARLLLAAVFAVAGLAKLADRTGSHQALLEFGVPARLVSSFGVLLPLAELAVAVTLLPVSTAWWGALGALTLLLVFIAGIGLSLARGRRPDCRCFGQLHSAPAGPATLARNAALAAVTGFVLWQGGVDPGPSAVGWLGDLTAARALALVGGLVVFGLLALGGWLLVHLLRQHGRLLLRIEALEAQRDSGIAPLPSASGGITDQPPGLPVGAPAPVFDLPGLDGHLVSLRTLRAGGTSVLLLFADPNCGPCTALLPDVGAWQREHAAKVTIAVISRGDAAANRAKVAEQTVTNVLLQRDFEVADAYQAYGTPSAVLVRADGTIGSAVAAGADAIRTLVASATFASADMVPLPVLNGHGHDHPAPAQATPRIGEPAPALRLSDVHGHTVDLASFRGRSVFVLSWSHTCGFCTQMLEDLRTWDASPPDGAPQLLVLSAGDDPELNRAMGLRSPVLADRNSAVAGAFNIQATPTGILVDAEGRIGSAIAMGAQAVLAMLHGQPVPSAQQVGQPSAAVPSIGDPAPSVKLPDPEGKHVDLERFRGRDTLLVFWNPSCGFCQNMLDDLRTWETKPPNGAPQLVVVSAGSPEENRAMGLRSPVLLDQGFATASAFGAHGTPSGILIDARGTIASEMAVGAQAVLQLATGRVGTGAPTM